MKKFLLALAVFGGVTFNSFAQSKDGGKFSIGFEAGIPLGATGDFFSTAIGGSLKYDQPIADKTSFTISAGYTSFLGKTITISGLTGKVNSVGFIPVKAGVKYYLADSFYGEAQLGAAINTQSGGGTAFAYSPGIGYKFSNVVDLGIRYEVWSKGGTTDQVAARLGFSF